MVFLHDGLFLLTKNYQIADTHFNTRPLQNKRARKDQSLSGLSFVDFCFQIMLPVVLMLLLELPVLLLLQLLHLSMHRMHQDQPYKELCRMQ